MANSRVSTFDLTAYDFMKTVGQIGSREEDLFFSYEITLCVGKK